MILMEMIIMVIMHSILDIMMVAEKDDGDNNKIIIKIMIITDTKNMYGRDIARRDRMVPRSISISI